MASKIAPAKKAITVVNEILNEKLGWRASNEAVAKPAARELLAIMIQRRGALITLVSMSPGA